MTITRGDKGASFIYNGNIYNFSLMNKGIEVDSTGAGDAFISSIIKDYAKNKMKLDETLFEKWYNNTTKITLKVVSKMGARGHINSLFKIQNIPEVCACDNFIYKERKKIKRCNININNLEARIINAINSSAPKKLEDIRFNENDNCLFIGTGGSYAGSYYASTIINNLLGCNTYALYPRDVVYRNNAKINKIILFSYSGTTNDIIKCVKGIDNKNVYMITKGEVQQIVLKTGILKKNIISYRTASNKGKERGFLSFEGAVVPAAIFLKYYQNNVDKNFDVEGFIKKSIQKWNDKLEEVFDKSIVNKMKSHGLINIFRGDYTNAACYDLESKIIESGVLNCIIHEKKNFSHGRFINFENLNNKISIYFKQKTTTEYEAELLKLLGDDNIIIESEYDGILAEFDLLIASQFIVYYIGKTLDIDMSKPDYSDEALKVYFYKGDL